MERAVLSHDPVSVEPLLELDAHPECGGLALFVGTVRDHHEGRSVRHLKYTAHEPLAEKIIRDVEAATREKYGVPYVRVVHRLGDLSIGDVAIVCVVRAPHRAEAFDACRYAVDAVKHGAPIWKEEFYTDGSSAFVEGCCIRDDLDETPPPSHRHHSHTSHG
ncbi:molybdenum cofactor biosynthesis protein MoaE [Luteibacter rhizovicinus DSM 16549]|uniref:Molybdopterin synthase catalytic subunit n=1 Tax=Luteibacter rhizovicinus DSM 16549 TaxID=1440763 RepID=A0A0G9H864_9GAMM|nr:molybdenum cofactor biosynthesis protein MoaE [Luteibacter rhizovicinus]APG02861.1 molybdenum cofactor biosynthesis protein MoaE [Luteibacter rhizovicinus DSM 16549]KLD65788.1 molybdenum cofactor biosynthesis protein MoaE [Luteibacter rhizovicinus DSM 16549]KLD79751.1 molybdenum cofactor biosynthesis protein MoaE [Xanthomonas hyacinthi DSM 19077]